MKDKFNITIISIISVLVLLISIFIYLNNLSDPHVAGFSIIGSVNDASFVNQRVQLSFNRPMDISADLTKYISIQPASEYLTSWSGNTLNIIFKNSLSPDTEYRIVVSKDFKDSYGNQLKKDNINQFQTKKLRYAYIQNSLTAKDKIFRTEISGKNKELLLEEEEIKFFGINDNYLVAVTQKSLLNDLVIKDLKNNIKKSLNLSQTKIIGLSFSSKENKFLFISHKAEVSSGFVEQKSNAVISIYDLDKSTLSEFKPKKADFDVLSAVFSKDGETILFKVSDGTYYLSTIKDDSLISLGKFAATGGFNKDLNKIIFVNFDVLSPDKPAQLLTEFSSDRSTKNLTNGIDAVLDPVYFNNSNKLIYAQKFKDVFMAKGFFKIITLDVDGKQEEILFDENNSLELPVLSPDDSYVAIEKYSDLSLLSLENEREFGFQNKPYSSTLIIYDIASNQVIQTIENSINLQWLQ